MLVVIIDYLLHFSVILRIILLSCLEILDMGKKVSLFKSFIHRALPDGRIPVVVCMEQWQVDLLYSDLFKYPLLAESCPTAPCACIPISRKFYPSILIKDPTLDVPLKYFPFEAVFLIDPVICKTVPRNYFKEPNGPVRVETDDEYYQRLKRITIVKKRSLPRTVYGELNG